jgi:hypothetical protein
MAYRIGRTGLGRRVMHQLDRQFSRNLDEREAHERDGVRVISGERLPLRAGHRRAVARRRDRETVPGLAFRIPATRGVGFVLARSGKGPVYFWRGDRYEIGMRTRARCPTR